ncbi:hypothetical protein HDV05_001845 [Chytridiales sp. JEL 0842]|nr:hypothetical protein HDV05_001845 [Chytridiales sp. JEL 0842]
MPSSKNKKNKKNRRKASANNISNSNHEVPRVPAEPSKNRSKVAPIDATIWGRILMLACPDLTSLHHLSQINKTIRQWCWDSISFKANFLIQREIAEGYASPVAAAIRRIFDVMHFVYFDFPDHLPLLKHLITNNIKALKVHRNDTMTWIPIYNVVMRYEVPPLAVKKEYLKVLNLGWDPDEDAWDPEVDDDIQDNYYHWLGYAMRMGDLEMINLLLRMGDIKKKSEAELRRAIREKYKLNWHIYEWPLSEKHYHLEFLFDEKTLEESQESMALTAKRGQEIDERAVWQSVEFHDLKCIDGMLFLGYDVIKYPHVLELIAGYPFTKTYREIDDGGYDNEDWRAALARRATYSNVSKYVVKPKDADTRKLMAVLEPDAFSTLQFLLTQGALPNSTAFAHAVILGYEDVIDRFLTIGSAYASEYIHLAAFMGHTRIMKQLISHATKHHKTHQTQFKPVSNTFQLPFHPEMPWKSYIATMKQLIDLGIYTSGHFWSNVIASALHVKPSAETISKLCQAGAKVSLQTLETAAKTADLQTFKNCMKHLSKPLTKKERETLIHAASNSFNKDVCRYFLQDMNTPIESFDSVLSGLAFVWVPKTVGPPGSQAYKAAASKNLQLFDMLVKRSEESYSLIAYEASDYLERYLNIEFVKEYHEDMDLLATVVKRLIDNYVQFDFMATSEIASRKGWYISLEARGICFTERFITDFKDFEIDDDYDDEDY